MTQLSTLGADRNACLLAAPSSLSRIGCSRLAAAQLRRPSAIFSSRNNASPPPPSPMPPSPPPPASQPASPDIPPSPTSSSTTSSSSSLLQVALSNAPEWPSFLGSLANSGAMTGTLLDGIHSRVGLQVYDTAPLVLGGLHTSAAVPPLLAVFYLVVGGLQPLLDNLNPSEATSAVQSRCNDVGFVALSFGVLAGLLQLSATTYEQGVPYWQIHLALGTAALLNWRIFDGTRQGLLLAVLCGVGAPAAEVLLLQLAPLWHYPRADVGGVLVSWVPWCYFFYTPALGALGRYLWSTMRQLRDFKHQEQQEQQGQQQQRLSEEQQPEQQ
ncbi:hypothetical protein Agub_g11492 [Astrephomene gubernaculifera]|uniref:Uncharacterized protein n=1 Tax=Astrephomene gubernaculifera TaxID=47775 RepID=A0AAD3DYK4_9CHLO|nr:hypothetical protein Agub_g11492 [Astrephomene gubernaculifera]